MHSTGHPAVPDPSVATASSRDAVRALWAKLACFCAPYAVLLPIVLAPILFTGELVSPRMALAVQRHCPTVLYGPAYTNPNREYKTLGILRRRPEVLALGTSRTMQFRAFFLTRRPDAFFNAGGAVRTLPEMRELVESLPAPLRPRILIIGLDQYFFNEAWDPVTPRGSRDGGDNASPLRALCSFREALRDFSRGKFTVHDVFSTSDRYTGNYKALGLRARSKSSGFRVDGSLFDGRHAADACGSQDWEFRNTLARIRSGNRRFEPAESVNTRAIEELDGMLAFCRTNGIHVIGFLPPYAHAVLDAMRHTGRYRYLETLPDAVHRVFARHGFPYIDATDLQSLGSDDSETIGDDAGFHGSEVAYLRLFIRMAEIDPALQSYTDPAELRRKLENRVSPWYVLERVRGSPGAPPP